MPGGIFRQLKSPNRWSCLPTSFAMVLGVDLEKLITEIGHDGSEIIFPDLQEPLRRRAFHIQELIDCAIARGIMVTPIEALPVQGPSASHTFEFAEEQSSQRLTNYLVNYSGVLTGLSQSGNPHAVAWFGIDDKIIDPKDGMPHPLAAFSIQTFWLCRRLD